MLPVGLDVGIGGGKFVHHAFDQGFVDRDDANRSVRSLTHTQG
jgi:hypothetical protein